MSSRKDQVDKFKSKFDELRNAFQTNSVAEIEITVLRMVMIYKVWKEIWMTWVCEISWLFFTLSYWFCNDQRPQKTGWKTCDIRVPRKYAFRILRWLFLIRCPNGWRLILSHGYTGQSYGCCWAIISWDAEGTLSEEQQQVDQAIPLLVAVLSVHGVGGIDSLHTSFRDYLINKERSHSFFVDLDQGHQDLAYATFEVMKNELDFNIC